MDNPYRPPDSSVRQLQPKQKRVLRCTLAFVSGLLGAALAMYASLLLVAVDPSSFTPSATVLVRLVLIHAANALICAAAVALFRRFPLWLACTVGVVPPLVASVGLVLFQLISALIA
jgi:hypothetical protein